MRLKRNARAQDEAFEMHNRIASPRHVCQRASTLAPLLPRPLRSGDSGMGQRLVCSLSFFTTSAFLRRSMNAMAVRSGPLPAERQVTEPFARVTELAHQI